MGFALILLEKDMFSALGTAEWSLRKTTGEVGLVFKGEPFAFDTNNGIGVIYDEHGNPWIKSTGSDWDDILKSLSQFGLKRGAFVPHSNDGGNFRRQLRDEVGVIL